jgi:hypothetical protein
MIVGEYKITAALAVVTFLINSLRDGRCPDSELFSYVQSLTKKVTSILILMAVF